MKTEECFTCDLSPKCTECPYWIDTGYIQGYICGAEVKRAIEAWNYYHPDNLMPEKGFVVHHKNENKLDDSKNNIEKMTISEHMRLHQNSKGWPEKLSLAELEEYKAKKSEAMKGNQFGRGNKGKKLPPRTEEHKAKISIANKGKHVGPKSVNWKGGPPHCVDCGKKMYYSCKYKKCKGCRPEYRVAA